MLMTNSDSFFLHKINPFQILNIWPSLQQLFNTSVFILLGKLFLDITITWDEILTCVIVGISSDFFFSRISGNPRPFNYCYSGIVTAFATGVLLRSPSPIVMPLAVCLGVGQKYFFKVDQRHFHNPSNIAVLFALLAFPTSTYLDSSVWGSNYFVLIIVIICALFLLTRVKLFRLSVFLLSYYALLNFIFISNSFTFIMSQLTTTTFLLYSFFIINDPMSLPRTNRYRFLHIFNVVTITFFLSLYWGKKDVNIPLGLFIATLLIPFFRKVESSSVTHIFKFIVATTGVFTLLITTTFYLSPYNRKQNLYLSLKNLPSKPFVRTKKVSNTKKLQILPNSIWGNQKIRLFDKNWTKSKVISERLNSTSSKKLKFSTIDNIISSRPSSFTLRHAGYDQLPYGTMAFGDLNHDGLIDLVIGNTHSYLKIYINQGNHQFIEASDLMFNQVPQSIESIALADFNNDSYLDLLVIYSQYVKKRKHILYYFNSKTKLFQDANIDISNMGMSNGGIAVYDINHDGNLDFYLSYGINWLKEDPNLINTGASLDQFYVSTDTQYENLINSYFPPLITKVPYVGMTVLFTDYDQDRKIDFLLGNDFWDPSFVLKFEIDQFQIVPQNHLSQNTRNSMSFITIDFDSDGEFELWENGVSDSAPTMGRTTDQRANRSKKIIPLEYHDDIRYLSEIRNLDQYDCSKIKTPTFIEACKARVLHLSAVHQNNIKLCEQIKPPELLSRCRRNFHSITTKFFENQSTTKFDIEKFPKQLASNVLLKKDPHGNYRNHVPPNAQYTGWSWAAFPFDVNNDGLQDLYITNGFLDESHNTNKFLVNQTVNQTIDFEEKAGDLEIDFEDNSRAISFIDLDHDGDGDLVINNFEGTTHYRVNEGGGDSIQFELRSKQNYFGIGSMIIVETNKMKQVREVIIGGVWNTSQTTRQHFGIAQGDVIKKITVVWPDGSKSDHSNLKKNHIHYIYQ